MAAIPNLAFSNQRLQRRYDLSVVVKVSLGHREISARTKDISASGVGLAIGYVKPKAGDAVSILTEEFGLWRGKVQWVGGTGFGVLFDEATQRKPELTRLIARLAEQES